MAEEMETVVDETEGLETAFTDAIEEPQGELAPPEPQEPEASEPAPEPSPEPSPFDELLGTAREAGLDVEGLGSEADLARSVLDQLKKQQPYVSYAQQLLPHADEIKEYFTRQEQAAQPPPRDADQQQEWSPGSYFQEKYGGPQWKPEYTQAIESGHVQRDGESGMWVAAPGHEIMVASLLGELNQAQQHTNKFWQSLSNSNPYEQFYNVLREPLMREIDRRVEEVVGQREANYAQQDVVSRFESDNASWMYQTDPTSGQRVPTESGQAFIDTVADLRDSGITDPGKLIQIASRMHKLEASEPEPPAQQKEPQEKQQSFLDNARKRAGHAASARPRGGDETPQVMTEGDLESLFERTYRETSRK